MNNIIEKINNLKQEEVLEAILACRTLVGDTKWNYGGEIETFLNSLEENPNHSLQKVEEISKIALVIASQDDQFKEQINSIIDTVGNKAFVFGATEILMAAALGVLVIHTLKTGGKKSEKRKISIEKTDDGKQKICIEENISYGVSNGISNLITSILKTIKSG